MTNDIDLAELEQMSRRQKEDLAKNIFVRPSIWSRLKKLPIYLHREGTSKEKKVHISDENLAEKVPKEREKFLRLVKEYPEVIDEIEKHPRLEQIVFTSEPLTTVQQSRIPFSKRKRFLFGTMYPEFRSTTIGQLEQDIEKTPIAKQIQKDEAIVAISLKPKAHMTKKEKGALSTNVAGTVFHELRHVGQIETYHKQPKDYVRLFKGKYEKQKGEIQAEKYAKKGTSESRMKAEERYIEASKGRYGNPNIQEAIKRADLLLKRTY